MTLLAIGLMSGTSMDGIDAAIIETDGLSQIKAKGTLSFAYENEFHVLLKAAEFTVRQCFGDLDKALHTYHDYLNDYINLELKSADQHKLLLELKKYLGIAATETIRLSDVIQRSTDLHAEAVKNLLKKYQLQASKIDVIGYHGQTLYHQPENRITVQVGDAVRLASLLKIKVVFNFRQNDIEHGGQGAPFAPLYHQALVVRDQLIPAAIVNCGGVTNITVVYGEGPENIIGFDVGPGSGLLDRFVRERSRGQERMDTDGNYALHGKINEKVLTELFEKSCWKQGKNYFESAPPKSLDIRDFELIPALDHLSMEDGCATLAAFTGKVIVDSLSLIPKAELLKTWILAGGGWNNPLMLSEFEKRLKEKYITVTVHQADTLGWSNQGLEAQIFAYLAVRRLKNLPISFPSITNVPFPLIGGEIVTNDAICV